MLTLNDIKMGEHVVVTKLHGDGPLRKRILEMGINKKTEITLIKVAPLGDPIEIRIKGYNLSLRKDEAKNIEVSY